LGEASLSSNHAAVFSAGEYLAIPAMFGGKVRTSTGVPDSQRSRVDKAACTKPPPERATAARRDLAVEAILSRPRVLEKGITCRGIGDP
jgi:hypothetical protein